MTSLLYNTKLSYADNRKNFPIFKQPLILTPDQARAPVGIAAGPLLDSNFVKYAVDMGAGIVVYKTIRSVEWDCLPHPNCIMVDGKAIIIPGGDADASRSKKSKSMTNSFGMPSDKPEIWQPDVLKAQKYAEKHGRRMIVSVVGSPTKGMASLSTDQAKLQLAKDYARAARLAIEAGATEIELNLSCPNVDPALGAIYMDPDFVAGIIAAVRAEIGYDYKIHIKVGYFSAKNNVQESDIGRMVDVASSAVHAGVNAITGINTISMNVHNPKVDKNGNKVPALPGRFKADGSPNAISGVCGKMIEPYAMTWLRDMIYVRQVLKMNKSNLEIGASGGVCHGSDFKARFREGADMSFSASGAMLNPKLFAQFHGKSK